MFVIPLLIFLVECVVWSNSASLISLSDILQTTNTNTFVPYKPNDTFIPPCELIKSYRYPCEVHSVVTQDGYVLQMHRIPSKVNNPRVVLIMHGFLESSADWIFQGPKKSLVYILNDLGYDVWFGNHRGNIYSNKNIFYDIKDKRFWDFSFDELGEYDNPALIDYVLTKTGHKSIYYIGHSQGATSLYATLATKTEYNKKIKLFIALAPAVLMGSSSNFLIDTGAKILKLYGTTRALDLFGNTEIVIPNSILLALANYVCTPQDVLAEPACVNIPLLISGFDLNHVNRTVLDRFLTYSPAGGSVKQFVHYCQLKKTGVFQKYDHGLLGNVRNYQSPVPPLYNFKNINVPIVMYYGSKDNIADRLDMPSLKFEVDSTVSRHEINGFYHLDFVVHEDANVLLYNQITATMAKY